MTVHLYRPNQPPPAAADENTASAVSQWGYLEERGSIHWVTDYVTDRLEWYTLYRAKRKYLLTNIL